MRSGQLEVVASSTRSRGCLSEVDARFPIPFVVVCDVYRAVYTRDVPRKIALSRSFKRTRRQLR